MDPWVPVQRPIRVPKVSAGACLLIVPPFARLDLPNLAVHLLQACARAHGHEVHVLYPGMHLAEELGPLLYHALAESVTPWRLGERLFAAPAFGLPRLGRGASRLDDFRLEVEVGETDARQVIDGACLHALAAHLEGWVPRMGEALAWLRPRVVGATTVFEQVSSSYALLRQLKACVPEVVTVLGGANCAGPLASGILSLGPAIDYVFSGESEQAFPEFLQMLAQGKRPDERLIRSEPCQNLEALPTPDFADYGVALDAAPLVRASPLLSTRLIPYETSRGCWWGQKHACTFCAVEVMQTRQKSPEKVVKELQQLIQQASAEARTPEGGPAPIRVQLVDDLMPHSFFTALLPRLQEVLPGLAFFCNQKSNLKLESVMALQRAGVTVFQAGVEALSDRLLQRMNKGVTARQNIALLRSARATGLRLVWNLLHGLPGDEPEDYADLLRLLPLVRHLPPPQGWYRTWLLRFSPYVREPERFGIRKLRPAEGYADLFPSHADLDQLAYFFEGEYSSVDTLAPDLIRTIGQQVTEWRRAWLEASQPPQLHLQPYGSGVYLLRDSRGLSGTSPWLPLSLPQAVAAVVARPVGRAGALEPFFRAAAAQHLAVEMNGWYVPLATAPPPLLLELEQSRLALEG